MVTGSRAEYGILYWLLRTLQDEDNVELQIIVTGMHLSPEFGLTYKIIEEDGFFINEKVRMLLSDDTETGMAHSIGLGVIGMSGAFDRCKPDILVVLGDRFEILAAAQAAMCMRIPIAHIHGGEATEGAIDEAVRHAVTKMSHLHFVAAEEYQKRVIQMGEDPKNVFNFGAPGLDHLSHVRWMSLKQLEKRLDMKLAKPIFLVSYHPVTLETNSVFAMKQLLLALDEFPDASIVITYPNADTQGREIINVIESYIKRNRGRVKAFSSLGQQCYLSLMKECDVVIGNSSSGLTEAPALKKVTVNIGTRQRGRLKASSILDCEESFNAIKESIRIALSAKMQERGCTTNSLYGNSGNVSSSIGKILKNVDLSHILKKEFRSI